MNALRVGIAGYGIVGQRRRTFVDKNPHFRTVGVCDKAFPSNGEFDDGVRYFSHFHDLLELQLDVLFVCLVNNVAAEVTIAGLERGLHVFCEKPPGRNIEDIAQVLRCEKKHPHLKLKYGFNHRYHDSVLDALKLVRSGTFGKIINIKGVYGKSKIISFGQSDWRAHRHIAGGGILLDQGIHMVDLIRLFGGDFTEVYSFISNDFWRHDVEDNAYALMKSPTGVVAMLHSTATQWRHRFEMDISLEKGAINLTGILSGSKSYGDETMTITWAEENGKGDPVEQRTRYNADPSWQREIEDFGNIIAQNLPILHGSSADAFNTMQLVYRIYCADPVWKSRWTLTDKVNPWHPISEGAEAFT